jgi:hypothetical protein
MDIILTIPSEHVSRIVDALCGAYDYENRKLPGESKEAFAKRMVIRMLREHTLAFEANAAADAARDVALAADQVSIT